MPYCSNCGAYIPDGETKCVACGSVTMPSQAGQAASASSAAFAQMPEAPKAPEVNADELRETLEAKQKEQQEKNREWAENAREQYNASKPTTASAHTGGTPSSAKKPEGDGTFFSGKLWAGLSYVSFLCLFPLIMGTKDEFVKFHAKQGLVLCIASVIIDALVKVLGILGIVLSAFRLYLIYKGIKNVIEEKKDYLPYIGKYAEKF